jgi:hypothetical protein
LWCYWHHLESDVRAEKVYTKWLPGMFPTPWQSLAEVYSSQMGLFCRKCDLNDCTVLYSSEIQWFLEHFEETTHVSRMNIIVQYFILLVGYNELTCSAMLTLRCGHYFSPVFKKGGKNRSWIKQWYKRRP